MNERRRHPLHGLRPPGAPRDLRTRVLAAASAVTPDPAVEPEPTLTDRLWESRPLRLAWAAALALLLAANLYLDRGSMRAAPETRPEAAAATPGASAPLAPPEPRTLLAARGEVFQAVLGDPLSRGGGRPFTHDRRRLP